MTHLHLLFLPLFSALPLLSFCTARTVVVCSDIPPSKPLATSAYFPHFLGARVCTCACVLVCEVKNSRMNFAQLANQKKERERERETERLPHY